MDITKIILQQLKAKGEVRTAELAKITGITRTYIKRVLKSLQIQGRITLVGKANQARYVSPQKFAETKKQIKTFRRTFKIKGLQEDNVLFDIKNSTGIFIGLHPNVISILDYAFTEMLNNAIDHSQSPIVTIFIVRTNLLIHFEVIDHGIGIFKNIRRLRHLKTDLEAIQDLIKGKQTTAPQRHSGEGIFFTSKLADELRIQSFSKRLIFSNVLHDVFVADSYILKGTKVSFTISTASKTSLSNIFAQFAGSSFKFDKTKINVKLFQIDKAYVSRSQARRIMVGLEKFKRIVLDFADVKAVGQAFADEVFKVWQSNHPEVTIEVKNIDDNAKFMIKRAGGEV